MANPDRLGAAVYEAESSFAEDVTTFATWRAPTRGAIDTSGLVWNKVDSERTSQYRGKQAGNWINSTIGGSFKFQMYLFGHGSATSGSTTVAAHETLLGLVFGASAASASSGTTFTGGTAAAPTTTASATFSAGAIGFAGSLGDARGGGQAFVVSTHATTTLNLLTALPAGPSNADVCHSAVMIHPNSSPTATTFTSTRWLLQTANLQYECHGCYPTAVSITGLSPGELPMIEVTFTVAWWRPVNPTFPSTVSTDTSNPAVVAAGSLFVNDVGTSTRATRNCRSFTLNYTLAGIGIPGPGGVHPNQEIVACRRGVDDIEIQWTEDADASTTTPVLQGYGTGTTQKHVLYTLSTAAGSRLAIYAPNVAVKAIPTQFAENSFNRMRFTGECQVGTTLTTELTRSPIRFGLA